jgi:hypothetical protein
VSKKSPRKETILADSMLGRIATSGFEAMSGSQKEIRRAGGCACNMAALEIPV